MIAESPRNNDEQSLHRREQEELLRLARNTVHEFLSNGQLSTYHTDSRWFNSLAAVFVTLRESDRSNKGRLRGCVGQVEPEKRLFEAVQDAAIKAATADPRFEPVRIDELPSLVFEISVLSPLVPVRQLDDFTIGRHGLMIVSRRRRGLLLPEVPVTYGWNKEMFLANLCRKAGLNEKAWSSGAELWAFTAESFGEKDFAT